VASLIRAQALALVRRAVGAPSLIRAAVFDPHVRAAVLAAVRVATGRFFERRNLAEVASATDALQIVVGRHIGDTAATQETLTAAVSKYLSDTALVSETLSRSGSVQAEDSPIVTEELDGYIDDYFVLGYSTPIYAGANVINP
jgi:hypothetical protein